MKFISPLRLFLSRGTFLAMPLFLFALPSAQAQRETFDASNYFKEAAISTELSKAPAKTVERKGSNTDGKPVSIKATDVAMSFDNVYFKLDSIELRDKESAKQVGEMAAALRQEKLRSRRFLIEGHTCDLGEEKYNQTLSAKRAQAIRAQLIAGGIAAERLFVIGLGESEQIATPGPRADAALAEKIRTANRRVVLRLLPDSPAPAAIPKIRK